MKKQTTNNENIVRLNKFLAECEIAPSRRKADDLILKGEIKINGKISTELGVKINIQSDKIQYRNKPVIKKVGYEYLLMNKPKDVICSMNDDKNRKTVQALTKYYSKNILKPVGRLDRNSTGLLLLTDDGNLIQKLTHPSNQVNKIYQIELDRIPNSDELDKIHSGSELEDGFFIPDEIVLLENKKSFGIKIHSGKNRILRRYFESFNFKVKSLDRVVFAGLTKLKLPRGKCRFLTNKEIEMLKI